MSSQHLWTALLVALAVGSVMSSPSSSELGDIIRRLEAAEAEITALKDNKEVQEKEIADLKSLMSQCGCGGQVVNADEEVPGNLIRSQRQANSAVLEDALGAILNHFKHQGISIPDVGTVENFNKTSITTIGSIYTRWGRKSCDGDSSLVYEGFAAGAFYSNIGGGSNYLCLPHNPEYNEYSDTAAGGEISGVEYETHSGIFPDSANEQNVPCAQCLSKRSVVMMLPARRTCPNFWTKEYEGYLMASPTDSRHGRSTYVCVDVNPEYVTGQHFDKGGAVLYFVKPICSGEGTTGQCPPYVAGRQLTCVVCTK